MLSTATIPDSYTRNRHALLFFTLLLSLIVLPLSRPLGFEGVLLQAVLAINLLAGVLAMQAGFARKVVLVALLLAVVGRLAATQLNSEYAELIGQVVWAMFALLTAWTSLVFALRGSQVGSEQVFAALSAYLLAGLCFGQLYWAIDQHWPASISEAATDTGTKLSLASAIYYSYVTLASLGYGDILPVSDPVRGLAVVEVLGGQMYLAALVARLVSALR
jgi:hypothetical protein